VVKGTTQAAVGRVEAGVTWVERAGGSIHRVMHTSNLTPLPPGDTLVVVVVVVATTVVVGAALGKKCLL
jgi:hypothetical protein